jgi:hypothetical protein
MFFTGPEADAMTDEHEGYVAGRCRDGSRTDIWTDVTRCGPLTFIAYLPVCECGWTGPDRPFHAPGYRQCQHDWVTQHFAPRVLPQVRRPDSGAAPTATGSDFDFAFDARVESDENSRRQPEHSAGLV